MAVPPPPSQHDWNENGEIEWIEVTYPRDISSLLLRDTDEVDEDYGDEDGDEDGDDNDDVSLVVFLIFYWLIS